MFWLRFWFPLIAYSGIIFCISNLPASTIAFTHVVWDKLLHTGEYAFLGLLAARAFKASIPGAPLIAIWAVSVVFCFGFGLSDEFHQSFIAGRESALADAYADLVGGSLGATVYLIVQHILNIKKEVGSNVSA